MKIVTVTVTDDDVKGIAADNDIPELEWVFALERVRAHATEIEDQVQALANKLAENLILFGKVDWS